MSNNNETYISVDVETAGPNPSTYSLLSIGACVVFDPQRIFYVELQPVNEHKLSSALAISGLDWDQLKTDGLPPKEAMSRFADWVGDLIHPIFVAFNAPFDWMFVNDYFHRYLRHNPFGHSALDIKAFYMRMNSDHKTVAAMDVLVPNIGEIITEQRLSSLYFSIISGPI